jgi:hypothetical protein
VKLKDNYSALRAIHSELATIAERTKTMAHANLADPCVSEWVSIMDRQDDLLAQLSRLDGQPLEL